MDTRRRRLYNNEHNRKRRGWIASRIFALPVLDVGVADGYMTSAIPGEVVAVDLAKYPDFEAKNAEFVQGDIYDLPFEDATFGTVCAFEVLEHLNDPLKALQELRRVGFSRLYVTVPSPGSMIETHGHVQDFNDLRPLVVEAGFVVTEYNVEPPFTYLEAICE